MINTTEQEDENKQEIHSPFAVKPADRLQINFAREDVWEYIYNKIADINAKKDDNKPSEFEFINAGIGKPGFSAPQFVLDAATKAISDGFNQYVHPRGSTQLINELARIYSKRFNFEIKAMENVQATRGSAGAYDVISRAFINKNDEVVCLEPIWTYYVHQTVHFGGILKSVRLDLIQNDSDSSDGYGYEWKLDINKLKAVLNKNTKLLVLNSPHNPTGFVLPLSQMKEIQKLLLEQYPHILLVTDEVYECMVYNTDKDKQHYYMASLSKEMWQRTITISSASKTFSVTGWRIGWIIANKQLMKYIRPAASAHCGGGAHPLEVAVAESLKIADNEYEGKDNYYIWLRNMYHDKCKLMVDAFKSNGFHVIIPDSTYFMLIDVTDDVNRLIKMGILKKKEDGDNVDDEKKEEEKLRNADWQFVIWIMEKIGVLFVPCSAFDYDEGDDTRYLIRVSFCIKDDDLKNIKTRLGKLREILNDIHDK